MFDEKYAMFQIEYKQYFKNERMYYSVKYILRTTYPKSKFKKLLKNGGKMFSLADVSVIKLLKMDYV